MKRLIFALGLMAMPILAQVGQDPNEKINQIMTLKYIEPRTVQVLLTNFQVSILYDQRSNSKVITLFGQRSHIIAAQDAIKQLDVPSATEKDIDLTVYFLVGSDDANLLGSPVPADLASTVSTLKSTFPFKTYVLLDALSLRTRSGTRATTTGQLSGGRLTNFAVNSASVEGDATMIRLDGLKAGLRVPVNGGTEKGTQYLDTGISTDIVDVKEGQKLVVGRSSLNGPDRALFLVLIAKIAQ